MAAAKRAAAKKPAAKRAPAKKPPLRRGDTATVKAVRAELRTLNERKAGIKDSALAAGAIAVAKRIDDPDTTAAAAASCLRALERAMTALHALAPEKDEGTDPLDALAKSIADRLAAP